jgi:hypothetical protein
MIPPDVLDRPNAAGAERAAAFFRKRGLDRVVEAARQSFWRNRRAVGRIAIGDFSEAEHQGLAALDGSRAGRGALRLSLASLDQRLRSSAFGCGLEELLIAHTGGPLMTRRDERAAADEEARRIRAEWRGAFTAIALELPTEAAGRRWLEVGPHGIEWLTRRYASDPP